MTPRKPPHELRKAGRPRTLQDAVRVGPYRFPAALLAAFRARADERGIGLAEAMRRAVTDWLRRSE